MADTDLLEMPSAIAPDEGDEERKRRLLTNAQGMPPARPPEAATTPASTPTMPAAVPAASSRSEASSTPLAQPSMPPAGRAEMAGPSPSATGQRVMETMPSAPVGPATQRLEDLQQQGRPELHGWKKVLDVIGQLHPIGRAIEANVPGSPQFYDAAVQRAAGQAGLEQKTQEGQQRSQENQQTIEENARKLEQEPATTDLNRRNIESEITARGDKDSSALARMGLKRDENGAVVADEESPVYKENQQKEQRAAETQKNLESYRQTQMDLNEARTATEKAKNDPNSPAYKEAQQKLLMAQEAHAIAAKNLGLHEQEFGNKLQEQELVKPSGQTVSRGDAAGAALKLLPGLKDSIRQNAKSFGPIVGRIAKGEIALGNVDPEVQKFYSQLQSFYSLQPAIHGFRNAEFVKDFNTFVGNLQTNPESLIAGLEGLEPTLKEVEKSGRTYKQRIVEGGAGGGKPATAGAKTWNPKTGRYE